jgi:hypothetical protein
VPEAIIVVPSGRGPPIREGPLLRAHNLIQFNQTHSSINLHLTTKDYFSFTFFDTKFLLQDSTSECMAAALLKQLRLLQGVVILPVKQLGQLTSSTVSNPYENTGIFNSEISCNLQVPLMDELPLHAEGTNLPTSYELK